MSGMWWDTLAQIVFGGHSLSESERLEYEKVFKNNLSSVSDHTIKSSVDVTKSSNEFVLEIGLEKLYMQLWKKLLPLRTNEQKSQLELFSRQLNITDPYVYPMMQDSDVKLLSEQSLFEVGAHTQNHVQLPVHDIKLQKSEIQENVKYLNKLTGQSVCSISYPFGSYDRTTVDIVKQAGFEFACTTVPEAATRIDSSLLLPRITVNDASAESLQSNIDRYF